MFFYTHIETFQLQFYIYIAMYFNASIKKLLLLNSINTIISVQL